MCLHRCVLSFILFVALLCHAAFAADVDILKKQLDSLEQNVARTEQQLQQKYPDIGRFDQYAQERIARIDADMDTSTTLAASQPAITKRTAPGEPYLSEMASAVVALDLAQHPQFGRFAAQRVVMFSQGNLLAGFPKLKYNAPESELLSEIQQKAPYAEKALRQKIDEQARELGMAPVQVQLAYAEAEKETLNNLVYQSIGQELARSREKSDLQGLYQQRYLVEQKRKELTRAENPLKPLSASQREQMLALQQRYDELKTRSEALEKEWKKPGTTVAEVQKRYDELNSHPRSKSAGTSIIRQLNQIPMESLQKYINAWRMLRLVELAKDPFYGELVKTYPLQTVLPRDEDSTATLTQLRLDLPAYLAYVTPLHLPQTLEQIKMEANLPAEVLDYIHADEEHRLLYGLYKNYLQYSRSDEWYAAIMEMSALQEKMNVLRQHGEGDSAVAASPKEQQYLKEKKAQLQQAQAELEKAEKKAAEDNPHLAQAKELSKQTEQQVRAFEQEARNDETLKSIKPEQRRSLSGYTELVMSLIFYDLARDKEHSYLIDGRMAEMAMTRIDPTRKAPEGGWTAAALATAVEKAKLPEKAAEMRKTSGLPEAYFEKAQQGLKLELMRDIADSYVQNNTPKEVVQLRDKVRELQNKIAGMAAK